MLSQQRDLFLHARASLVKAQSSIEVANPSEAPKGRTSKSPGSWGSSMSSMTSEYSRLIINFNSHWPRPGVRRCRHRPRH